MGSVVTERKLIIHLRKMAEERRYREDRKWKGQFDFVLGLMHRQLKAKKQLSGVELQAVHVVFHIVFADFLSTLCVLGLSSLNIKFSDHLCICDSLYSGLPLLMIFKHKLKFIGWMF